MSETDNLDTSKIHIDRSKGYIRIYVIENENENDNEIEIYRGGSNIECILEAMSLHFGYDGAEFHERPDKTIDPLEKHSIDSLSHKESEPQIIGGFPDPNDDDFDIHDEYIPVNEHDSDSWEDDD